MTWYRELAKSAGCKIERVGLRASGLAALLAAVSQRHTGPVIGVAAPLSGPSALLGDQIRTGAEAGVFLVEDAGLTAMAIIQMLTGVIVWFRPDERLSVEEVTNNYLQMTMRLVGADHGMAKQLLRRAG